MNASDLDDKNKREGELLEPTTAEIVEDSLAIVTSGIPILGGPVSAFLASRAGERAEQRITELIGLVREDVRILGQEVREDYVRTEDFEELFLRAAEQVSRERDEAKRRMYAALLATDITNPELTGYDEKIRHLRSLEELQPAHLMVLRGMMDPKRLENLYMGSQMQVLRHRLPNMGEAEIDERLGELAELGIVVRNAGLRTLMTADGAHQMAHLITPYGQRLLSYLRTVA